MRRSLEEHLADYLAARRRLGWDLSHTERAAGRFIAWLADRGLAAFTAQHLAGWAEASAESGARRAALVAAVNPFARYARAMGVEAAPVAPRLVGRALPRPDQRLLTADEIRALGQAAAGVFPNPFKAATMKTLVGLGAVTGMRIGEAIGLDEADLDPEQRLLAIRRAKSGKERINPLADSTVTALGAYLALPARLKAQAKTGCPALFLSVAGTRLWRSNAESAIRMMLEAAGIGPDGNARPRWHSFRYPNLRIIRTFPRFAWWRPRLGREGLDIGSPFQGCQAAEGGQAAGRCFPFLRGGLVLLVFQGGQGGGFLLGGDVEVHHLGLDGLVAEQERDPHDVHAVLEPMRRFRVAVTWPAT
ncbi:MAG: tyrosine-type recombinase/integrase [Bifidobacteriaceae bacterium]|jgi:integrase|nr:tyrosine-type recombinase/integrase [Bifidobacteriaceae bacterium]